MLQYQYINIFLFLGGTYIALSVFAAVYFDRRTILLQWACHAGVVGSTKIPLFYNPFRHPNYYRKLQSIITRFGPICQIVIENLEIVRTPHSGSWCNSLSASVHAREVNRDVEFGSLTVCGCISSDLCVL